MPGLNLTREEARTRAELVTVHSYNVALDLTTGEKTFRSTTTVLFDAKDGAETFIDAVTERVHSITLNGETLDPAEFSDGIRIRLPKLQANNELTIDADAIYSNTGEGLHRFVDPVDDEVYLYTQFEVPDSRRMFAVFEQPDLKATFSFTVTAPAHWALISNSPTPEPSDAGEGKKTWAFEPTQVMSSYVTALIAGPYEGVFDEVHSASGVTIPLGVFARKSLMQYLDAENIFRTTKEGFGFYEKQFGTPYPFPKYDQLFVPEFNAGAMENAGAVTILEAYVFRSKVAGSLIERRAITVLHELAHMWFGDLVTMRWWNDLWLNESFAEFMSTLAAAEATEYTAAWTTFSSMEKSWAYRQDQLPSTHPIMAEIRDLEDVQVNFDGITYAKGASVLRQLVAWVGQEEFMAGVREYFAKHAFSNTELTDLMVELEASSGRDLSEWTELWLKTAGVNTLTADFDVDGTGVFTRFTLKQTAIEEYPTLRPHRLAVGLYNLVDGELKRTERVELDVDGESTEVTELIGVKQPDLILVNDDDLAYTKIRLDERSLVTATTHLKDLKESLPRTLLWAAAWDSTRDALSPARAFVELVLNNIDHENDSSVITVLLRQLATTVNSYVAADASEETKRTTADRLWSLVHAAEAGSDLQYQLLKSFSGFARTDEQLNHVQALLDGDETVTGIDVDQDLRWELLTSLAAGGRATEAEIEAELGRDKTQNGQLAATTARGALPTSEAKQAVWDATVRQASLANSAQRAAIAGFNRSHDSELLAPFASSYFDEVKKVWDNQSHELALTIATGLFPSAQISDDTVHAAQEFIDAHQADSPSLARVVAESRDDVVRVLRARAADK